MTTGWRCPNCGKVYSPHVMECAPCNKAVDEAKKPKDVTGPGCLSDTQENMKQVPKEHVNPFYLKPCPKCLGYHHPATSCFLGRVMY